MKKQIASIIVTFNKKNLLREALEAHLKQTYATTVFIIDNDSQDGTGEMVAPYADQKNVFYYNTHANLGGAGGFHYGIQKAAEQGYDYFWLLDDDAVPYPTALEELVRAAEHLNDQFGFLCSNVRFTDGSACKMNIPDLHEDWLNSCNEYPYGLLRVDRATFVGFFVKRSTVEMVGLPIKEFFIWSDDTNYSHRIAREEPCYLVMDSLITHKMAINETASLVRDKSDRLGRYFYAYRNRLYNAREDGNLETYFLRVFTTTIRILMRSDRKAEKLKIMYKGVLAGLFFHPKVEYLP